MVTIIEADEEGEMVEMAETAEMAAVEDITTDAATIGMNTTSLQEILAGRS